ncbi:MAG: thioredoxin family protein [Phycisphaerales bacterium]|nr:thioredoxin family protein [Phycisphaerales bacterium]
MILRALLALIPALAAPAALAQPESPATVTVKPLRTTVTPGDRLPIAVVFDTAPGWHINTNDPVAPPELGGFVPFPTTISVTTPPGARALPTQWPTVQQVEVRFSGSPVQFGVFDGRAVAFIPLTIAQDAAPGTELSVEVKAEWQTCDDSICLMPDSLTRAVKLSVISLDQAAALPPPLADADFASFDPASYSRDPSAATAPRAAPPPASAGVRFQAFGWSFTIDPTGGVGLALLLLTAALGGFLLNLTPCVMPVIPLKIMGLSHAAGNPARCLYLGVMLSVGVVAFWMAIGLAIAFISGFTAISTLFRTPWFSLGVGVFIAAMAVGMLGLFSARLPQAVYLISPNHETARGSFLFGIMTAVLSTPCTAPFMGAAAAWAATQNPAITLATFAAIGAGMALPYLVLSARPQWVARFPRTGPASELVKQVMGLLMLAVAAFFLGVGSVALVPGLPAWAKGAHWWAIAGLVCAAALWLIIRTFQITRSLAARGTWTVVGGALAAAFVYIAVLLGIPDTSIPWRVYGGPPVAAGEPRPISPADLAALRDQPVALVIDFTADWCLNCKTLEQAVLRSKAVVAALNQSDVVPVKVDLTASDAAGWSLLKEYGAVGIPLLVIEGPGLREPFRSNAYTPGQVLDAVRGARGQTAARR